LGKKYHLISYVYPGLSITYIPEGWVMAPSYEYYSLAIYFSNGYSLDCRDISEKE